MRSKAWHTPTTNSRRKPTYKKINVVCLSRSSGVRIAFVRLRRPTVEICQQWLTNAPSLLLPLLLCVAAVRRFVDRVEADIVSPDCELILYQTNRRLTRLLHIIITTKWKKNYVFFASLSRSVSLGLFCRRSCTVWSHKLLQPVSLAPAIVERTHNQFSCFFRFNICRMFIS